MSRHYKNPLTLRQLTGMSQESFAAMLGTSRSSVAMAESEGRDLPNDVFHYQNAILLAMQQTGDKSSETIAIPATARQRWKKKLLLIATRRRYEAERMKRRMDKREQQAKQKNNRLKLAACVEQAHAELARHYSGLAKQPVTGYHKAWLQREKQSNNPPMFDEKSWLQQQRDLFRYTMLLQEAAEAERLAAEME